MFRNATMFMFPSSIDFSAIDDLLRAQALKPVGALEMVSQGFIPPYGRDSDQLCMRVAGDFLWITVGTESKILPGAALNKALEEKIDAMETEIGRRPGGKARKRIKDDLIHEMLPRAFVTCRRTDALIDTVCGVVYVNTSSRKVAENVMSEIRGALGSFPALPVNAEVAPRAVLTGWIAGEPMPDGLSLGEESELKDPIQGGAVVKCSHQELRGDEIDKHLEAGKQVTRLALVLNDNVAFVLGDDLVLRKVQLLDGAMDKLERDGSDGAAAEFDARATLFAREISAVFDVLQLPLRISAID